jgi:hypothetical protein
MRNYSNANPTIANCIFWGNIGGEIYSTDSSPVVMYSNVQGSHFGVGNINADPKFIDATGGDLHLGVFSPCVDAGYNAMVPTGIITDLDGLVRFVDEPHVVDSGLGIPPIVDMGAYERQTGSAPVLINVPGDLATIQAAINFCFDGDEVVVGPGTYPETIDLLGKAITVRSLSGPLVTTINGQGTDSVVTCETSEGPDTVLEGFTITGGTGKYFYDTYHGGGMFISNSSPIVKDCVFSGNVAPTYSSLGGGIYIEGFFEEASPTVANCVFTGNVVNSGGGMYIDGFFGDASAEVVNCLFYGNSATLGGAGAGGGICNSGGDLVAANCTISGNSSSWYGGGISNNNGNLIATNCVVWGNGGSAEIYNEDGTVTVVYSNVEGGYAGDGNISGDPLFVNPAGGNYRVGSPSPCIDAGSNDYVPADTADLDNDGDTAEQTPFDLDGGLRVVDDNGDGTATVDMGAYELLVYGDGSGTAADPYQIWTAKQMNAIGENSDDWDKHFILMDDIDMSIYSGTQYNIIGDSTTYFSGTFDGNGHVIRNLTCTRAGVDCIAVFGYTAYAPIKNLGLENVNMTGNNYIGGLVGWNTGTLTNCYVTGSVNGYQRIGGLVGGNISTITDCYTTTSVTGGGNDVAGLVGWNSGGTISRCYATGSVSTIYYSIGGLVGWNSGMLTDCYARGSVSGTASVGGLVGFNEQGILTNCYATGLNNGTAGNVGGFVGGDNSGSMNSCFWDTQTSGMTDGVGNVDPDPIGVTGKITADMQMLLTFTSAGWDFVSEDTNGTNDIWRMCVDDINYPHLFHQYNVNGDFACPDGTGADDLLSLSSNWLNSEGLDAGFSYPCDPTFDGLTNLSDYVILAEHWLEE